MSRPAFPRDPAQAIGRDEDPAAIARLAATEFEPWTDDDDLVPDTHEWIEFTNTYLPLLRTARQFCRKTKPEICEVIEKLDEGKLDEIMHAFDSASGLFKSFLGVIEAAEGRIFVAMATLAQRQAPKVPSRPTAAPRRDLTSLGDQLLAAWAEELRIERARGGEDAYEAAAAVSSAMVDVIAALPATTPVELAIKALAFCWWSGGPSNDFEQVEHGSASENILAAMRREILALYPEERT